MIETGKINELTIARKSTTGFYLNDYAGNEVLLPNRYITPDHIVGEKITVFVYRDSEDRQVSTTETPKIHLNEFAYLQVKHVTPMGAFLDWGLSKDLLVPFSEQVTKMVENAWYVVYLYLDQKTDRLVATSRITHYLQQVFISVNEGDQVDLLIFEETEIGFKAIVNEDHEGLIYKNEVFQSIKIGDRVKGYVKKIREDKKIDLTLNKSDRNEIEVIADRIVEMLKENGGFLDVSDKSNPEKIKTIFHVSKKVFKKAIGNLYKQRVITITDDGIKLIEK